MRLDKFLCNVGIGTRSEVKKVISKGRVSVDGNVSRDPGAKVDENNSLVSFDGKELHYSQHVYFMLNKPQGVISASRTDLRNKGEVCVIDLIKEEKHRELFPVGRLDKDTVGLLLITDDGVLAHNLLSPKKHVDKKYYVELEKPLNENDKTKIEAGIDIGDDTPTLPASIEMIDTHSLYITIREGRFHEIKRMFEAVDNKVLFLKRIEMGALVLDKNLDYGEYRPLTEEELLSIS